MMKKMQWQYGKGLGRELQGRFEPLSSAYGQQDRRGLGYSENRKKEKYEIRSPIREPNLNHIFFVPQASGEFQSKGKTYPGLEIFMTDFEEKLIKLPEPSFEQLVEDTEFMVSMVQADTEAERSKRISEFEDFLGIADEASKMVQEQKAKARILQKNKEQQPEASRASELLSQRFDLAPQRAHSGQNLIQCPSELTKLDDHPLTSTKRRLHD
ncbi:hypothetical protein JCGZ_27036 [Jatropha curcas]|uniref:G-patch domain-containing protein n=1 Tax=Jatropha curcas TaxID=180498 RepID=A0A067JMI6_JATCU|nr:hypothetical protein JCGZ_27036 [Jatropha curcas]